MKVFSALVVVALSLVQQFTSVDAVTKSQETGARNICSQLIKKPGNFEFLAGFVRLAFHDCVGGCNGCIDNTNGDNAGLDKYIDGLEQEFDNRNVRSELNMSRADFWALCATEAVKEGVVIASTGDAAPVMNMKYGRKDCNDSDPKQQANDIYPDAKAGLNATLDYFNRTFGYNERETVVILGAHTLGRARLNASGYEGPWKANERSFTNQFYRDMISLAWHQENKSSDASNPKWQWTTNSTPAVMMLNTDICLVKDINPDNTGRVAISFMNTANSTVRHIAAEFSDSNAKWLQEFGPVFMKMLNRTDEALSPAEDDPPPPTYVMTTTSSAARMSCLLCW